MGPDTLVKKTDNNIKFINTKIAKYRNKEIDRYSFKICIL